MPPGAAALSVEFKLNLLAPGEGDRIVAEGRVVRSGRTLTVTEADVYAEKDGARTKCATMLQTLICLPSTDARPAG